jgi:hypothetical protein
MDSETYHPRSSSQAYECHLEAVSLHAKRLGQDLSLHPWQPAHPSEPAIVDGPDRLEVVLLCAWL